MTPGERLKFLIPGLQSNKLIEISESRKVGRKKYGNTNRLVIIRKKSMQTGLPILYILQCHHV